MTASREEMMQLIKAKYPKLFIKTTEEFNHSEGGIWSSSENSILAKDGHKLLNYYGEGSCYEFGVHKELNNLLEKNGWYGEWYDSGTIMFYLI